jgi:putative restriction endonuclease
MPLQKLRTASVELPPRHRKALDWFAENAETIQKWPGPLPDGTFLASRAKGIYKPEWSKYALSIRQTLKSPYDDHEPVYDADGSWTYLYFEEYTNVALMDCIKDRVPIGVMRQVQDKPNVRYKVLGLAYVTGWEDGFFTLSNAPDWVAAVLNAQEKEEAAAGNFDAHDSGDGREKTLASIVRRRGQPAFRHALVEAYAGRCAISGSSLADVLEAAHIVPYNGPRTNHTCNGLLLRSDLHTLFDLGRLAIETKGYTVILAPELAGSDYARFAGKQLALPVKASKRPSKEALDQHRRAAGI